MSGSIPGSLGNLSNLETLDLRRNQLSGSIPNSLGNLSILESLLLSPGNDELCAPNDEAFQAWLKSIGDLDWTGPTCTPGAPTGLTATAGDGEVTLSWTAPTNTGAAAITDYEYEVDGAGAWTATGGAATSHTVTGLTNGQEYSFRVRAVNSVGAGAASGAATATPAVIPVPALPLPAAALGLFMVVAAALRRRCRR